ncbi:hypothetical protein Noda2021_01570 [Candidatus Dependentiae bacterium Noda2021]|nr:hypothetical protein Noda2021_01570 [Candidatus Dependentiae bacterium Noda2021]
MKIITLTPPLISNIKEKITCIRGHRERIFNTSLEHQDHKYIFHNYGHGGAGWTFLFGCVHESIRQFEQVLLTMPSLRYTAIAVVGAGCYGLLTAILLARKGHNVTIYAKEQNTLASNKAAGFFFPRPRKVSNEFETAIFFERGMESYRTYLDILAGKHPFIQHGPKLLPAYYGLDIDPGFGPYQARGLLGDAEQVIIDFGNNKSYPAMAYQTIYLNPGILMEELNRNSKELGIPIITQSIDSLTELTEDVVFNCSGLGAKKLAPDARMIPIQGHLITLTAQPDMSQLQYLINFKVVMMTPQNTPRYELLYYAPKDEGILGITFLRGQDSLTSNAHEFDRLLQRAHDFFGT